MSQLERLLGIMRRLRDPRAGCPWDREQTYATIAPYTIEEAYEVADAIERGDLDKLKEELGDLLFQVVFHAQIAGEAGCFDFEQVAAAICDKLERRHPNVFGDASLTSADEQSRAWESHKARERDAEAASHGRSAGVLDGIPAALPALSRAAKLQRRAARVGFDWQAVDDIFIKIDEELAELREALRHGDDPDHVTEELGDLLFAMVNVARYLDRDPEAALRRANAKFERRFRHIEHGLTRQGRAFRDVTLQDMDALWDEAKRKERD
jgi:ATP diphosphatase